MRAQRYLLLSFSALLLLFFGIQEQRVQADTPIYKQLAAPPEEMATMRLPDASALGIRSHSAMIPVELVNGSWRGELLIESSKSIKLMALSNEANWAITLQSPTGATENLTPTDRSAAVTTFGSGNNSYPGVLYTLNNLESGVWQVTLTGDATRSSEQGMLLYANPDAAVKLYSHLTHHDLLMGKTIGLNAYAFADADMEGGAPAANSVAFDSAEIVITLPNGTTITRNGTLQADGAHSFEWEAEMAGDYTAQVRVTGSSNGEAFQRTSEHLFRVVDESVRLAPQATTVVANAQRLQVDLAITDAQATSFLVSAELWGTQNGRAVPVAWIGGISDVVDNSLPITVDGRWIARANASAPFSLRNVTLKDVSSSIPVESVATVALDVAALPASAELRSAAITDDMLMGVRPEQAPTRAPGGKLMLVHGYCSSDVWPSSQFTNDIKFQDFDQNRSHNEFATRIRDFGASYPSFNVVAHSQGGAASLHLYTYYWSGLDYANTSRLIQSVGTPYQGTSLAGNLALLGQIFGVGCGTNYDLTYSGAAAWLSGIPNWARDDVYYATTSFTDKWWRYDYCNFASDLVLSDPDDGTTEKAKGQLSGGNNMGHKTGWCHTSGMRDPAQTQDSSRNALMNSYGDGRDAGSNTPKIVVDGNFDDWQDQGGLEYCLNDNGELKTACITSNQFSHIYFLTTAASSVGTVCSVIDTDADSLVNYQACYAADGSAEFVTLYSCSNNASVCADATTVATYPANGFDVASNTIEFGIGLNDLGITLSDSLCWSTHAATDSLPAANERICYNTATGEASFMPTDPTAVTQVTQQADRPSVTLIVALALSLLSFSFVTLRQRND